ncbi:Hypothetical predicted protein [Octopus vulgaris]|uniref:Retrotransposon gag domain-containing protein n=1 Tax=Octopus vulgaris TaxID=6645 RepID=A0AA36FBC7_OCTVU|nr:Hypothetical predicted protein [Octopus vulgaris]
MSESDCNNPDTLLEKFERHLEPRSNHRIHRYEFQGLKQDPQGMIDNFLSRLKNVAEKCKFKDKDERIVDQLIWGCAHKEVQKSLIGKDALQLIEAVDTARAFEATTKQMASLSLQTSSLGSSVDIVSRHRTKHSRKDHASTVVQSTISTTGKNILHSVHTAKHVENLTTGGKCVG